MAHPGIEIQGKHHIPDEPLPTIASIIQVSYMSLLFLCVPTIGNAVMAMLGLQTPALLLQAHQNQMTSMFLVFYVGNMIHANLMKSGAFEIVYNDKLVWSKIEAGQLPTWPELATRLSAAGMEGAEALTSMGPGQ